MTIGSKRDPNLMTRIALRMTTLPKARLLVVLAIFLFVFGVQFLGIVAHNKGLIFVEVVTHEAIVRKIEPLNHAAVYYEYSYNNRLYCGVDSSDRYNPGDRVKIVLAKSSPQQSVIAENLSGIEETLLFCLFTSFFIAIVGGCILVRMVGHCSER